MSCIENYCIENPTLLYFIIPIAAALFIIMYLDFIGFKSKEDRKEFRKRKRMLRFYVFLTRLFMVFLLLFSFAAPYTTETITGMGDPVIKVLTDNTESMGAFSDDLLSQVQAKLSGKIPVEISQISAGKTSNLGEGIIKKIQGGDNLFIISDGNNHGTKSLSDVGIYSRISDSKLFALQIEPDKTDAQVEIIGPSQTIEDTLNTFLVKVTHMGNQPAFTLQIYVDEKLEFSGQGIFEKEIVKSFSEGSHKITAKIVLEDHFAQNNVYYKSVKTVKKPPVLFVSSHSSPIESGLKQLYDLTSAPNLPSKLDKYHAIILNDVSYRSLERRIDDLTGYLLDGGGIVFFGGENSFDRGDYDDTLVESMLPVNIGSGKIIDPFQHNIVIVLDVSGSFTSTAYQHADDSDITAGDLGKAMAVKMIEDFRDDVHVGVVAFAGIAQTRSEIIPLANNRDLLISKIQRTGKGDATILHTGLDRAQRLLRDVRGTKNVVFISDGKQGLIKMPARTIGKAQEMAQEGITIYTVGLPSELSAAFAGLRIGNYDVFANRKSQPKINEPLMKKVAEIGNGQYFAPGREQYLNVFFGKPEAKEKVFSGQSNLAVVDQNHFITSNLDIDAEVTGINFVVPKIGAKSLVFTADGNPVVNTWNFGLGRVVTFASDDGRTWAGDVLSMQNSILLSRMINYAVGNPERDKEIALSTDDGHLGEDNTIVVRSTKFPVSDELTFVKERENIYKASFTPSEPGYFQFFDSLVAINDHREFFQLGFNENLREMTDLSGGKILTLEDDNIAEQIQSLTERTEQIRKDMRLYPLALLLLIYLIELLIRKIYEYRQARVIA